MENKQLNLPKREEEILKLWEINRVFEKSLEKTKQGKPFIFYEGPPTANGLPHVGHALTRAFKDVILRYKTMRGFFVPRKAGWDTHGLPVEIEVEKTLGLKTKQDIERYGVAKFNQKAKESVWRYKDEWEKFTKRLGFLLDMERPYITYETTYIETLWRIIKEFWKKGLLYEDFKVVPWCPRCQTALSTHEVGLGYKTVKDRAVYVKFKLKKGQKIGEFATDDKTYILAWTTTAWTLPGNVALAVGKDIKYSIVEIDKEKHIRAAEENKDGLAIKGKDLIGLRYEPLFTAPELESEKSYRVYEADFVSRGEGTGVVHTAVMYGEDDYSLGAKIGLPRSHTVDESGHFIKSLGDGLGGLAVKDSKTEEKIIEILQRRNFLLKEEQYEHEYPFCWRCSAPLLYYARQAWWVKTTAVKKELLANNEKINWIPPHIKRGRFGEFLREVRDWAFSRERYWGTPLPVWRCGKCGAIEVVGSREELAERAGKSKNRYFIMRHGEARSNVKWVWNSEGDKYPLTPKGRAAAEKSLRQFAGKTKIDFIVASDIIRAKETAEIAASIFSVKIVTDNRLRELNPGVFEGKSPQEYHHYYSSMLEKFYKRPPGGESLADVRRRGLELLGEFEKKHSEKNILLVGHEYPLWMLYTGALGFSDEEAVEFRGGRDFIDLAEIKGLKYRILPRDESGAVNLHRPYADDFELECSKCGGRTKRVSEVVDGWFDSGAMPFASQRGKVQFPADYITEAVDQTRGWFYTLLVVSTLLGKSAPYKNVISLGHVLDKYGQKMSKSKGNVVDPGEMMQKYGADTLRWYFYTINPPGEPKRFDDKDMQRKLRGFLMTFWNSFVFFDTYVDKLKAQSVKRKITAQNPRHILDQWVFAKLRLLVSEVSRKLDAYDITGSARAIEDFVINDFSQWYLRRSRRRFQHPESVKVPRSPSATGMAAAKSGLAKQDEAAAVTAEVLLILCKIIAPFAPFLSETIYRELSKKLKFKEASVHLLEWPFFTKAAEGKAAKKVLDDMRKVREIVGGALKLRAEAGIKVRQPLRELGIMNYELKNRKELLDIVKEEVNVKEIIFGNELKLDTSITPELKEEGIVREIIRNIQEMRRDAGLKPKDGIRAQFSGAEEALALLERWKKPLAAETGIREFRSGGKGIFKIERELDASGAKLWIGIS